VIAGSPPESEFDAIVIGAGHNGLVAAALLARAGYRVLVLERSMRPGGAAASIAAFPDFDARISRYAYLLSLFPRTLLDELGLELEVRRRPVAAYTPDGEHGVLFGEEEATRASMRRTLGEDESFTALSEFQALTGAVAARVFDSLTEPLRSREDFRELVGDERTFAELFERPLAEALEARFRSDLVRGTVATDALIGTFAPLADRRLRQNRCFLYHVIGNGTGRWDVPVGGMGALTSELVRVAEEAGVALDLHAPVVGIVGRRHGLEVVCGSARTFRARHVLAAVAPVVLHELLGHPAPERGPEGAQLKLNFLLSRLPRLRDTHVSPEEAFAGTFHVNEGYAQLEAAYAQARAGEIPELPPCEAYCHSLTDPSILGDELRARGAQTLTVFGLHMPARLFEADHGAAKRAAVEATLRSLNSVLAEPLEACVLRTRAGEPCVEAHTPIELEAELGLPGGHIFHRDLQWPFAEDDEEVGRWGVETAHTGIWLCGAGARRGGGVSGIPGHNAARAVIEADSREG
jgi:phytoene dehydrogenase-like protein